MTLSELTHDMLDRKGRPGNTKGVHDVGCSPLMILASSSSATSSPYFPSSLEDFQAQLLEATNTITDLDAKKPTPRDEISDGPLCEYRKGFVAHLTPKALATSVSSAMKEERTMDFFLEIMHLHAQICIASPFSLSLDSNALE
jgi:hypothetical protein